MPRRRRPDRGESTARLFGRDTPRWLAGFGAASVGLLVLAVLATGASGLALVLALVGVAGFAGHLLWQLRQFDMDDSANCLKLFRANRDAGLIVALFFFVLAGIV